MTATKKMPDLGQAGTAMEMALKIERIRKTDPANYTRIMRKLAQLERQAKKSRAIL